ncbi:MAG: GNAT family N-acetyltransferase [Bacteroidota bacterium]
MNLQPTLADDLITLKPLEKHDFTALYNVAKDPLIWEQHPCHDRFKIDVFTTFFDDSIKSNGALVIVEQSSGKIIGSSRFKKIKNVEGAIEIGWSFLAREYWGGRYNKSMKELMINYAFNFVEDVIFYIGPKNIRSQKAVQKIGGKRITDAHLKHLMKNKGTDWTYRINKKDWRK